MASPKVYSAGAARGSDGGFEVRAEGYPSLRAKPDEGGWCVGRESGLETWRLERSCDGAPGFVLSQEGVERGRTMPLAGAPEAGLRFLLLDDGRLFRILRCGARESWYELLGWETPGPYLEARPVPEGGWRFAATAAGSGLEGVADMTALIVLLAAEVLDAEEPLSSRTR